MSNSGDGLHAAIDRRDVVTVPVIWVTLFLSLGLHVAMLWFWLPRLPPSVHQSVDEPEPGKARVVLVTRLAVAPTPVSSPPPSRPPRAANQPTRVPPPPAAKPRPPPPPILAADVSPPEPLPLPAAERPPPRASSETDLASYVEARRRARGDPTAIGAGVAARGTTTAETESERRDRIVAANLAPSQQPTFGYDPRSGGGVFQLKRIGYEDAEFYFAGWNKDINRHAKQLIEVRKGNNNDIRLAIVRKMIAIIRDEVQDEFTWNSERTGRQVLMSARLADNAALEEFLMQEFFSAPRRPR